MPVDDEYRKQVQGKVQEILSERHEKPTLKLVIEAVIEGVKLYRSYKEEKKAEEKGKGQGRGKHRKHRNHREEGAMGEARKNGYSRHGHGNDHESSGRRRHRRHRSRSRDEERGRHQHSSRDERRSRSRHRHRDESHGERRERSRSRDRRSRSRRRDGIRDPVTQSSANDDSEYQMTGGAGPADTLHDGHRKPDRPTSGTSSYQTSWRDLSSEPRSRSHPRGRKPDPASGRRAPTPHRSARKSSRDRSRARSPRRSHRRRHKERSSSRRRDRPSRVGASRSPTRQQKGPDGTPFGSLPEYQRKAGIALGFGDHFMNTYRHIKAEHEAGYRTKGKLETTLDKARKKSSQTKEREKIRKSEPERVRWAERYPGKIRGDEWKPTAVETEAWERCRRDEEERRKSKRDSDRKRADTDKKRNPRSPIPEIRVQPPTTAGTPRRRPPSVAQEVRFPTPPNRPPPAVPEPTNWQHTLPQRLLPIREAYDEAPYQDTPPSQVVPPYPDTPPSPVASEGTSGSSSPRLTPAFLQSIPMPVPQHSAPTGPPPPPPPPAPAPPPPRPPPSAPPLPAARLPNNTGMAALLGDIQGGIRLRKVADSEKKDNSNNPRGGRVLYEETAHSHDVEEHERAQVREVNNQSPFRGNSAWSTTLSANEEDDVRPGANSAFRDELAKALAGRGSGIDTSATRPRSGSDDSSLTSGSRTSMIANESWEIQDEKTSFQRLSRSESGENLIFTLAAHIARPEWNYDGPRRN